MKDQIKRFQKNEGMQAISHINEAIEILKGLEERTTGSRAETYRYYAAELSAFLCSDHGQAGFVSFFHKEVLS